MMKEKFLEIYRKNITRPGADKLLAWLETTDFFTAPASTRFHLSRPGGLVDHSVHVYERLDNLVTDEEGYPGSTFGEDFTISDETIAICGLLHDICKANFYTVEMRNRKNEQGQWEKYPFYVVDDQLPLRPRREVGLHHLWLYEAHPGGGYGDPLAHGLLRHRLQGWGLLRRKCLREVPPGGAHAHRRSPGNLPRRSGG